jgi:hypothetical protein
MVCQTETHLAVSIQQSLSRHPFYSALVEDADAGGRSLSGIAGSNPPAE